MQSLKSALGKQDKKSDKLSANISQSLKKFSKSKSQSIWSIDYEHQPNQSSQSQFQLQLQSDQKLLILHKLLKQSYQKNKDLSNITLVSFDRICEQFQDLIINNNNNISSSGIKSEISYYLVLEDKLTDLIQIYTKKTINNNNNCQKNNNKFNCKNIFFLFIMYRIYRNVSLTCRKQNRTVKQMFFLFNKGTKQKKTDHLHPNVNGKQKDKKIFRKKSDFLQVNNNLLPNMQIKSKQKSSQRPNSKQYLNRLLSKQKIPIKISQPHQQSNSKKHFTQPNQQQQMDDYQINQTMYHSNQSVSFSTVISTTMTVKQRRNRKSSGHNFNDDHYMFRNNQNNNNNNNHNNNNNKCNQNKNNNINKKININLKYVNDNDKQAENQEDNDKTDKAFIFFRPKKSKKN